MYSEGRLRQTQMRADLMRADSPNQFESNLVRGWCTNSKDMSVELGSSDLLLCTLLSMVTVNGGPHVPSLRITLPQSLSYDTVSCVPTNCVTQH